MKEIQLTQGQVALVDDEDFEYLNQWRWCIRWSKNTQSYYAMRTEYKPFQKTIYMHRVIVNTPKGLECDHINHDTLDNQKHNLRNITHSQNMMNRRTQSNNKLGVKGVFKYGSVFRAQVRKDGKIVFDKTFTALGDAIVAHDDAIKKYHGEFTYQPEQEN